jgi:hypothetical protein
MKTSETIGKLAEALAKAQPEMGNAAFDAINPHFKSKYATLASVRDAVTMPLAANGLAIVQLTSEGDGKMIVHTRLMHSSGEWIESAYPIINDVNKPQAMGSALTYARRYSLASICSIASEQDDDGNAAQEHGKSAPESRNIAGTPKASKANSRFDYERIINEMHKATSVDALKEWLKLRRSDIEALPDDWMANFDTAYSDYRDELAAKVA